MAMSETPMSRDDLQSALMKLIEMNTKLTEALANPRINPMEQKKYEEELKKEKRRALLAVELGRAEAQARWNKQNGCSHCRYPAGSGKLAGHACPRGQGEWCTGGQVHGDDTASLICTRCGTLWRFQASPQEREYIRETGGTGMVPPPIDRCLNREDFAAPPESISA